MVIHGRLACLGEMLSAVFTVQLVWIFQRLPYDEPGQQVLVQDKDCILGLRQGSGRVWEQACMKDCPFWRLQVLQPLVAGSSWACSIIRAISRSYSACNTGLVQRCQDCI